MNGRRMRYVTLLALTLALLASLVAGCGLLTSSPLGATAAPAAPLQPAQATPGGSAQGGASGTQAQTASASRTQATAAPASTGPAPAPLSSDFAGAVRAVAQQVKPAIVQITNQQTQNVGPNQPFTVPAGVGSGVIYDAKGYILTNNHVIEGAQSLLVTLPDGRSMTAKLVGADPETDLAVVQISGDNLPVAKLGDSKQLQVGDWLVAIGNALALPGGPTVTTGVVSALGRTVQEPGTTSSSAGPFLFDVIQTDAPINPGNSGGALVNLAGEVIGINTLVAGQAEPGVQAQGIGFAIATNTAKPIADQLVASGKVDHPYLGIRYQWLDPVTAAQLGLNQKQGVYIGQVVSGSPAAQAGLRARDVVTAIDGKTLTSESSLAEIIDGKKPGDQVTLTVIRGGQQQPAQVTLGTMPSR